MKKFFSEFKTFITRGNVLDMAVGVIVGGAFTAIVNGLSNFILRPVINFLLSLVLPGDGLKAAVTVLSPAYIEENGAKVLDLANSIYIDWGSFISAIINFLLIAFVLFVIVKTINKFNEVSSEVALQTKEKHSAKKYAKLLKKNEIRKQKGKPEIAIPEHLLPPAPPAPVVEEKPKPTPTEALLTEIRDLLVEKNKPTTKKKK
jgi:large conductance mechanosensitive channel